MTRARTKALVRMTAFFAWSAAAAAQPLEAYRTGPHTSVSSDGTTLPRIETGRDATFEESFAGLGQAIESAGAELAETGAVVDGAEEVTETARDVWALWEAGSAGLSAIQGGSIIGTDTRTRVSTTTTFPARAIVLVAFAEGSCSGWMISKDTVATAGHCVHTGGSGGSWHTNVRVYPGRNGSSSPYGSCSAKRLYSVSGWTSSKDEKYDYGAIKLNCTVGNTTGWFGFFWQSASLTGLPATVAGYPGDKPLTQWKSTGSVAVTQERQVFYKNDTVGGQSGGPVYYNRTGCSSCSMAIHAQGLHGSSPHGTNNHATRITKDVFDNLVSWKNAL